MDTIAPQAFGSGNLIGVGLTAQRAFLVALLLLVPTTPLWICAKPILLALGQDAEVARIAARYMVLLLPGLIPFVVFEIARKFLYAQGSAMALRLPPLWAAALGLAGHPLWLRLWCSGALGYMGAPLALSTTYLVQALLLVILIRWRLPHAHVAWPRGPEQRAALWRDRAAWRHMASTSVASLCSLSEWLFWEYVCFRVGLLGAAPLAVYGIAYSLEPVFFMVRACDHAPTPRG